MSLKELPIGASIHEPFSVQVSQKKASKNSLFALVEEDSGLRLVSRS